MFVYYGAFDALLQGIASVEELQDAQAFFATRTFPAAQHKVAQVHDHLSPPHNEELLMSAPTCGRNQVLEKVRHNIACLQRNREPLGNWLANVE